MHSGWKIMAALALLVGIAVAGGEAAGGSDAFGSTDAQLLRTYEPVLLFHAEEDWAPQAVESYLERAQLERQVAAGEWAAVPPPLPTANVGCTLDPCLRLDLPCALRSGYTCYHRQALADTDWSQPVVYATVAPVPASASPPPGQTVRPSLLLHYWLFYAFDDWHSPRNRLWQTHEGDWESITIGLDHNRKPYFAAYSEHCSGTVLPWTAVTHRAGTHPVAYVALGSHAIWFSAAPADTRFGECLKSGLGAAAKRRIATLIRLAQDKIVDRMGAAHAAGPADIPGLTPLRLIPLDYAAAWTRFPGRWGEGQIVWLGSTPRSATTISRGSAPGTPKWYAPSVSAGWHTITG
jgi:hypothetical protein